MFSYLSGLNPFSSSTRKNNNNNKNGKNGSASQTTTTASAKPVNPYNRGTPAWYGWESEHSPQTVNMSGFQSTYGPVPQGALESNEDRKKRFKLNTLYRQLNNSNTKYNNLRRTFRQTHGVNWKNVGATVKQRHKEIQNQKKAQRFNVLKAHRNKEWSNYAAKFLRNRPAPGLGQPALGVPPRVAFGYGGRRTRKVR